MPGRNHRFEGASQELVTALSQALEWIVAGVAVRRRIGCVALAVVALAAAPAQASGDETRERPRPRLTCTSTASGAGGRSS